MNNEPIHFQTEEEENEAFNKMVNAQLKMRAERRTAAKGAVESLRELVKVCAGGSGQAYHLRGLLFSLWNGKPADVSNVLHLDWELRKHFCNVVLGFGWESDDVKFFYDAMRSEFERAGLLDWFLEEGGAR